MPSGDGELKAIYYNNPIRRIYQYHINALDALPGSGEKYNRIIVNIAAGVRRHLLDALLIDGVMVIRVDAGGKLFAVSITKSTANGTTTHDQLITGDAHTGLDTYITNTLPGIGSGNKKSVLYNQGSNYMLYTLERGIDLDR